MGIVWHACASTWKWQLNLFFIVFLPRLPRAQNVGQLYRIHHKHIVRCFRTYILQTKSIINYIISLYIFVWESRTICVPGTTWKSTFESPFILNWAIRTKVMVFHSKSPQSYKCIVFSVDPKYHNRIWLVSYSETSMLLVWIHILQLLNLRTIKLSNYGILSYWIVNHPYPYTKV